MRLLWTLKTWVVIAGSTFSALSVSAAPIELLLPSSPYSVAADRALASQIEIFNRQNPKSPVKLVRRGEEFSSLRELTARKLAGMLPDIAGIDPAELEAVKRLKIVQPLPSSLAKSLGTETHAPFRKALPLLFGNIDRLPGKQIPKTWTDLEELTRELIRRNQTSTDPSTAIDHALSLSLQGTRGLWIFEALLGQPLWRREVGGLKSNREIQLSVKRIQRLFDASGLVKNDESWEKAIQNFIGGKVPLFVGTSEMLPLIASRASFQWKVELLPIVGDTARQSRMSAGTDLVVMQSRPEITQFLNFLYSAEVAAHWRLPNLAEYGTLSQRSADSEVVRARSEWVQALKHLTDNNTRRPPLEDILAQIDGRLAAHSY